MKAFFAFLSSFLLIALLAASFFALDFFKRRQLAPPRTYFADASLAGMDRQQVRVFIHDKIQKFTAQPFHIAARGQVAEVTLQDMGVIIDESALIDSVPFSNESSSGELAFWSVAGKRVAPTITVSRTELLRVIDKKFPEIPKNKNAFFKKSGKKIEIEEAQKGVTPLVDDLLIQVKKNLRFFDRQPLLVRFVEDAPTITSADLEAYQDALIAAIPKTVTLTHEQQKWKATFVDNPQWIIFSRKPYAVAEGQLPFTLEWDPVSFSIFLNDNLQKTVEQAPEGVRIWRDESEKVLFEGRANDGRAIDREQLLTLVNRALIDKQENVTVPVVTVPPRVEISSDLQEMGVSELISVGHTRFVGSPVNRMHNIGVGIARFNGLIIPAGETFSFGKNLGPVDGSTGYRKELVIKPEGTIPEYGGGICQVSSTVYRAALNAGFPIVQRSPHSYVVTYYSQVGGHGLDATVYPPAVDLKFVNDTAGAVVVQAYVDGYDAYFKFYGTGDSREVSLEGPYISNKRYAPAEPLLVPDSKLKPGEKKQVEKAHSGFDVLWYRYITKNGEIQKEEIFSRYKAVPNKFLVGGETPVEPSADSSVNPFE